MRRLASAFGRTEHDASRTIDLNATGKTRIRVNTVTVCAFAADIRFHRKSGNMGRESDAKGIRTDTGKIFLDFDFRNLKLTRWYNERKKIYYSVSGLSL